MLKSNRFPDPHTLVREFDANRDSLLFLLDRHFHPQVMCADPGGPCARIEDTTRFLARNLAREEQLMELSGYPGAEAHKREHERLLYRLEELSRTLVCSRYDNTLIAGFLENWVNEHGLGFDKPFGDFLSAHAMTPEK